MFGPRIKISRQMMERIKEAVDLAGYSSVDEFVETSIERELERVLYSYTHSSDEEDKVTERLRGLGYIE